MLIYSPRDVYAHLPAALRALTRYRAHHHLSINALAAHMRTAGCETPPRTLLDLFKYADALDAQETPRHRPSYRTQFAVVRFHFHLKGTRKRAAAIRRRRQDVKPFWVATDRTEA